LTSDRKGEEFCAMKIIRITAIAALAIGAWGSAQADCIDDAAFHHGVNSPVLRAIGWHESRLKPSAVGRNQNGTIDIGAFQINSMHLGKLSKYGVDSHSLKNGCVSAYVAAWHYKKQIYDFGNTWKAVGAYHSRTPARSAWYANAIARVLIKWRVLPSSALPYSPSTTLAPGQTRLGRNHG
jgi:soluble lytic murein transglycosylase-like protein